MSVAAPALPAISPNREAFASRHSLPELLRQRLLILDGAMGTMIQRHPLTEEDFRGTRFTTTPSPCAATTTC